MVLLADSDDDHVLALLSIGHHLRQEGLYQFYEYR